MDERLAPSVSLAFPLDGGSVQSRRGAKQLHQEVMQLLKEGHLVQSAVREV